VPFLAGVFPIWRPNLYLKRVASNFLLLLNHRSHNWGVHRAMTEIGFSTFNLYTSNTASVLWLGAISHRVPSPKSQVPLMLASLKHGGKVPTCEPQVITRIWSSISKVGFDYFMQQYSWDLGWELGLAFCSTQFATQVPSLTSEKCCHVGIHVILGTWDLGPHVKW